MKENFEIFDFELEPGDMPAISALDQGEAGRLGPNPDTFDWIPLTVTAARCEPRAADSRATTGPIRSTTITVPTPNVAPQSQPTSPAKNWKTE